MRWPWAKPDEHEESADDVAQRLASVADDLQRATLELRTTVKVLRADTREEPGR